MTSTTTTRRRPYAARVPADVRREQLLDAAIDIIVREGYRGISIDAIAREAGVTRPVVYGVFDGLAPLLGALLDRQEARALAQLGEAVAEGPGMATEPEAFLVNAAERMIDTVAGDPQTWRPILLAPTETPGPVRDRIDRDRELVRHQLGRVVDVAWGAPGVDVEVASHALLAVLEHFGRLLLDDPARFEKDRLMASVRGLLKGLRPA